MGITAQVARKRLWLAPVILMTLVYLSGCAAPPPPALTYREYVEMAIGGTKGVTFRLSPEGTTQMEKLFESKFSIGALSGNELKPLPERVEIVEDSSWGSNSQLVIFRTMPTQVAQEFKLGARLNIGQGNAVLVPLTIRTVEAGDDISFPPGGWSYRADIHGPGLKEWPRPQETTLVVGGYVKLTYRETVEMDIGGYKGLLFIAEGQGIVLENRKVDYEIGVLDGSSLGPLPAWLEIVQKATYQGPWKNTHKSLISLRADYRMTQGGSYKLMVRVKVENMGVIGQVPLTIKLIESGDDIIVTPGGPEYRANTAMAGSQFPPVRETTVALRTP